MAMDPDIEAKYAQNAKVMVGSAILLFILILFIVLFRVYVHFCRRRRLRLFSHQLPTTTNTTSFKEESLDPSVLKTLPTFSFSSATHRSLHDCAVCLSEFTDGDEGRLLPNCNHAFHSHCIDAWFASHSNCPLCRAPVQPATVTVTEPCSVSVSETGEGCSSSFPAPIGCPRKPLGIIVEIPVEESRSDPVPGDYGFKYSLKRLSACR